jgi:hypothetical protein
MTRRNANHRLKCVDTIFLVLLLERTEPHPTETTKSYVLEVASRVGIVPFKILHYRCINVPAIYKSESDLQLLISVHNDNNIIADSPYPSWCGPWEVVDFIVLSL